MSSSRLTMVTGAVHSLLVSCYLRWKVAASIVPVSFLPSVKTLLLCCCQVIKGLQQIRRQSEEDLHAGFQQPSHGSKGKPSSIGPILSGGLEDIVNLGSSIGQRLEGGLGRLATVTRASIAKGQGRPKKTDGWKGLDSEGHQDLWERPDGIDQGTQVTNQPLS